jgi:hypothetical protein
MTSQDVPSFHEKEEHEGDTVPFSDCPLLNQALTVAKSGENNLPDGMDTHEAVS